MVCLAVFLIVARAFKVHPKAFKIDKFEFEDH